MMILGRGWGLFYDARSYDFERMDKRRMGLKNNWKEVVKGNPGTISTFSWTD